jgi:hypothetical protein
MIASVMPQWGKLKYLRKHVQPWAKATIYRYMKAHWVENIHYRRDVGNDWIYNLPMIADWLATGGGEVHQRAIEAWLASLPSNQPPPQKGKTPKSSRQAV